jgi:hypothetical protein
MAESLANTALDESTALDRVGKSVDAVLVVNVDQRSAP